LAVLLRKGRRALVSRAERATYDALHEASQAAPFLRAGLHAPPLRRSAPHLLRLLGSSAVSLTDGELVLATAGGGEQHTARSAVLAADVLTTGRTSLVHHLTCTDQTCPIRGAVATALVVEDTVVGALVAFTSEISAGLVRTVEEVARWVSGQLELAELDASRSRLAEAQLTALRAQISPHFVYNSLTTIASFVRTDPDRARELLLDFAEFTRYANRTHGEFTTLAEELRSIDRYLLLERARFGERLQVTLRIAPEVLPIAVPYLCLQPLVENAVKHGLDGDSGRVAVSIVAQDAGSECLLSIEDDGSGGDPERVRLALAGQAEGGSMALANIDARLRATYGDDHGLVVETAVGAGTKVSLRLPKFQAGVRAS
jgi:two-component system LytT family sensor kinase